MNNNTLNICSLDQESLMESYDSGYLSITPSKSRRSVYHCDLSIYFSKKSCKTDADSCKYGQICDTINTKLLNNNTPKCSMINYSSNQSSAYKSPIQIPQNAFKMELRSQKNNRIRPVDSPSFIQNYSNDMKMKLLIAQSTPNIFNSPILPSHIYKVAFSPISYEVNPCKSCIKSNRLRKLLISENIYVSKRSRPKKLDFSKHAILSSFQKQRATPDYTGKETIDIFKLLAEKSNHPRIITKILSYLNSQDLCSVTMVSKSWQRICCNDTKAEERRIKYVTLKQCSKENLILSKKAKLENLMQVTSEIQCSRRFLTAVSTNLLQVPKLHLKRESPPVSPSKVIFNSFIKASRSLPLCDQLVPCPQCKFACRVKHSNNTGTCSRKGCPMLEFCTLCLSKLHLGKPCKMSLLATPTKHKTKHQSIVGTKQCKRNLRRISRLT